MAKVWPIYGLAIPIPDFEKPSQYSYPNFFKIYNPDMTASELIINNYKSQSHGLWLCGKRVFSRLAFEFRIFVIQISRKIKIQIGWNSDWINSDCSSSDWTKNQNSDRPKYKPVKFRLVKFRSAKNSKFRSAEIQIDDSDRP